MLWNLFQPDAELGKLFAFVAFSNYDSEIEGVYEGEEKVKVKEHKYYERDSSIIRKKKLEASKRKQLFCEACGFDFKEKYGSHGVGFIECHHKYPIAKAGKRKTKLTDLALVCSNCHRMLHKKSDDGIYYKVEELSGLINR
jgi:predicted HNH restriction endonuclease